MPMLAGLSALGSLTLGTSFVYNTTKKSRKKGNGLYLYYLVGKELYFNAKGFIVKTKKTINKNLIETLLDRPITT